MHVGISLHIFLQQETVAFFDVIAFFDDDVNDATETLCGDVRVGCRLDFPRSRHHRYERLLLGHLGRLYGHHTFVSLVDAEPHDPAKGCCRRETYADLLPRLHAIPFVDPPRTTRVGSTRKTQF